MAEKECKFFGQIPTACAIPQFAFLGPVKSNKIKILIVLKLPLFSVSSNLEQPELAFELVLQR